MQDGEFLSLPMSAPISVISQIKTKLQSERAVLQRAGQSGQAGVSVGQGAATSQATAPARPQGAFAEPAQTTSIFQVSIKHTCTMYVHV